MSYLTRKLSNKDGNAIIEFALILPLLLLVVFGVTEFGRAIMVTNSLNTASREGARLAVVSSISDTLSVQARVEEVCAASNITPKAILIEYSPETKSIRVTVTTDFQVLSAGVLEAFTGVIELQGVTTMRYEG
jgi:Flp pilus assembly protein TadG